MSFVSLTILSVCVKVLIRKNTTTYLLMKVIVEYLIHLGKLTIKEEHVQKDTCGVHWASDIIFDVNHFNNNPTIIMLEVSRDLV